MSHYGIYVLQVCLCTTVFYLLFVVLFKNLTFFSLNRFYLLSGLILSFLIPLIKISFLPSEIKTITHTLEETFEFWDTEQAIASVAIPVSDSTTHMYFLAVGYFTGMAFLLIRLLISIAAVLRLKNKSNTTVLEGIKVVTTRISQPFSFFRTVFMPDHEDIALILAHERAHIDQNHWIDLILMEVAALLLWFNPLMILFRKEIKLQHEYLADSNALLKVQPEQYFQCLLRTVNAANLHAPVSQLYTSSIKKRILMISKQRTPFQSLTLYLVVAPLIVFLLFAFSERPTESQDSNPPGDTHASIPSLSPVNMKTARVVSSYGKRKHPYTGKMSFHTGIDLQSEEGEPVMAPADGVISSTGYDSLNGNYLFITHDEVFSTKYSHLRNILLNQGNKVKSGETIGFVGSTGMSTGPHLHYEVIMNGEPVDPAPYLPKQ
ncbi:MAG: peptidoglycan DD-metalloendopeptidase family protein [Bacteroidetes bacterium]|nr:peptidoglycan DD-metalloendopeptidase family protein [Bacteroidota bacterium]